DVSGPNGRNKFLAMSKDFQTRVITRVVFHLLRKRRHLWVHLVVVNCFEPSHRRASSLWISQLRTNTTILTRSATTRHVWLTNIAECGALPMNNELGATRTQTVIAAVVANVARRTRRYLQNVPYRSS